MSQAFRTAQGELIDRTRTLRFTFDGASYEGHPGDTLASALLANGVRIVGRSFKYHRPRGILSAGAEEPNALVAIDRGGGRVTPNLPATQVELYEGLVAVSQNRWPSLNFDLGAVAGLASALLPAGFYYKTFKWPRWAWRYVYEPAIRRMAGLGKAPRADDPDRYARFHAHCDVLVIGGGAAGLAAAVSAARAGARVILCDEGSRFGGALLDRPDAAIDGMPAPDWAQAQARWLASQAHVRLLARTTAFGAFAQNFVGLCERVTDHLAAPPPDAPRERLWQVRARRIVLATGAIERPLVFPNNDLPGIMLAGAARTYAARHGVLPGRRIVIAAAHDGGFALAQAMRAAGAERVTIVDQREAARATRAARVSVMTGARIVGARGRRAVSCVTVETAGGSRRDIACDLVLMSGGFSPVLHLLAQAGGKLRFDERRQAFVAERIPDDMRLAGACNGAFALGAVLREGAQAGCEMATACGFAGDAPRFVATEDAVATGIAQPHVASGHKAFVDFQNDVTADDIALAVREGFRSVEHIKRYTTLGMATDQGKTSNVNALAIAAAARGDSAGAMGHTTFRQPYTPISFGAFAGEARGDLFQPIRHTPSYGWASRHGAIFEDAGQWKRASAFPRAGESLHEAAAREARAVRGSVGLFDASTLGKIEVAGPDAAAFLDLIYVNDIASLAPGRCRYALMLHENGFVLDDGIVGRLAADRFHVTTTSGGVDRVLHHMEDFRQTEWPHLKVWPTLATEQWATFAVQGPRARDIVRQFVPDTDLDPGALPHMSLREGRFCGVPLRLFRVSFSGEMGYEINLPARFGADAWARLAEAVNALGGCAYGLDALNILRAEKGYMIVGQDTDGAQTPHDLGLGWMIGKRKRDFVGMRSLALAGMRQGTRRELVGLATRDPAHPVEEGAQIVAEPRPAPGAHALGHVTTACHSAMLGRTIALALIEDGRARIGQTLHVAANGAPVEVVAPVWFDARGERLHG